MSNNVRFQSGLTCSNCGSFNEARSIDLYTSNLGLDSADTYANPGDVFELNLSDFAEAYHALRKLEQGVSRLCALELWDCAVCHRMRPARLAFSKVDEQHWGYIGADAVMLSSGVLHECDYISRRLNEYLPDEAEDAPALQEIAARTKNR